MVPETRANVAGPPRVSVDQETQTRHGWSFKITVTPGRGVAAAAVEPGIGAEPAAATQPGQSFADRSIHQLELWWVDYEHWGHGQIAPERVAQVVVETLLEGRPALRLPARFDASTARRWMPELDAQVHGRM